MSKEQKSQMLLPFMTDDPNFCLGFEAGMVWGRMRAGEPKIEGTWHQANMDQFQHMAGRAGYRVESAVLLDHGWFTAVCVKK